MNRHFKGLANKQTYTDFTSKITATWQALTQPNTPSRVENGEQPEQILADLIAMPTVTGKPAPNHEALNYIDDFLTRRGLYVERLAWNGVESLVATTRRTKQPTVFLAGHIDVVPARQELFTLREEDGKLYGRGTLDMKGGIAGYLAAIRDLPDPIDQYDFGVMIMTDEEAGGFDGAQKLAEAGYLPEVMVLPDGGSNWNLEQFAKGIWHITIEVVGKSAHGSRPWEGDNALDKLLAAIHEIQQLFPDQTPAGNTINLGIVSGGKAINQIPDYATASFDMRFIALEDQQRIQRVVRQLLEKKGIKLVTELIAWPMVNDPSHPLLKKYAEHTARIIGRQPDWIISNAGSDGRFFAEKGVPCAIAYPPGGNHHGEAEYITQKGFRQFIELINAYLQDVTKIEEQP